MAGARRAVQRGQPLKSGAPVSLAGSDPPAAPSVTERGCQRPTPVSTLMNANIVTFPSREEREAKAVVAAARIAHPNLYRASSAGVVDLPIRRSRRPEPTVTLQNHHIRQQRKEPWRRADSAVRYWKAHLDFHRAIDYAQDTGCAEGQLHPAATHKDDWALLEKYRCAIGRQILTPAPDLAAVKWKQSARGRSNYRKSDQELIDRAIEDDLEFLAAHPTKKSNVAKLQARRDFKQAVRERIKEIAASRDLSDAEIKPAMSLKHFEIDRFVQQHGIKLKWLYEGKGGVFKAGYDRQDAE